MRKVFTVLTIMVVIVGCALWAPWRFWSFSTLDIIGIEPPQELATLNFSSLAGEVEIYIDGEKKGSVGPEGSPFLIEDIIPGEHLVKLQKVTETPAAYTTFQRYIDFQSEIDSVLAYELGPTDNFSEGYLITANKHAGNAEATFLNVYTEPEDVKIFINGTDIGIAPVLNQTISIDNTLELRLEKAGYETLKFNLLPEDEEARAQLQGYEIIVEANLFLLPLNVTEETADA